MAHKEFLDGCSAGAGVADASRGCRLRHLGHGRRAPSQQVETGMYVKTLTVDLACHASMYTHLKNSYSDYCHKVLVLTVAGIRWLLICILYSTR